MFDRIAANRHDVGHPAWKIVILSALAKALGVQFKVFGLPFGASYDRGIATRAMGPSCKAGAVSK